MYKKLEKLKLIRRSLEAGNLLGIALRSCGIRSYYTLDLWRQKNTRIDKYITACLAKQNDKRIDAVEDAHFKKMIDGSGSAADYIFYLCNRRPKKWKRQDNGVYIDQSIHTHFTKMTDEQLINEIRKTESDLFGRASIRIPAQKTELLD